MAGSTWTNDDGLVIHYGERDSEGKRPAVVSDSGPERTLVLEFSYDDLPGAVTSDGGITHIPTGAYLVEAYIQVGTAWAGGTSLAIGTTQQDGTAIDADGIFTAAELVTASLTAGATIKAAAGADVGTVISTTLDAYLDVTATGTFTAGTARLVVRYLETAPN